MVRLNLTSIAVACFLFSSFFVFSSAEACEDEAAEFQRKILMAAPFVEQQDFLETLSIWISPEEPEYVWVSRVFLMHLVNEGRIDPSTWEEVKPLLSGAEDSSLAQKVIDYYWELQYQENAF